MNRRSILAAVLLLLVMPLLRFAEMWKRPAFQRVVINGVSYEWSDVRVTFGDREFLGFSAIEFFDC